MLACRRVAVVMALAAAGWASAWAESPPVTGVWKSTDGGRTWTPVLDRDASNVTVDRAKPARVAAGAIALDACRSYGIRVESYEHRGDAAAELRWRAAGLPRRIVAQCFLFPAGVETQRAQATGR